MTSWPWPDLRLAAATPGPSEKTFPLSASSLMPGLLPSRKPVMKCLALALVPTHIHVSVVPSLHYITSCSSVSRHLGGQLASSET
jgi:hypothetical protein